MADKVVLGTGEVNGDRFKQLLHTIHAELATLLQTEGTTAITSKVPDLLNECFFKNRCIPYWCIH